MRPQPLIAVSDVEASSRWYQRLLGCKSAHGGPEYERLVAGDTLILQLHRWDIEHHHGPIGNPDVKPYGNGVLLWFELEDLDAAIARAEQMNPEVLMPRHRNPPSGGPGVEHRGAGAPRDLSRHAQGRGKARRHRGRVAAITVVVRL